jgi:ATP-binding cassette subfamily B protein
MNLLILTAITLTIPSIIRIVIDYGVSQNQVQLIITSSIVLIILGVIRGGLNYTQRYINEWIASHIGYTLRNNLYNHIQYLPFRFHDHSQSGQLISRCIEDTRAIERFAGFGVIELIRLVLMMIVITIILFIQEPLLAFISMLPLIPLVVITLRFGKRIGQFFYKVDNAIGDLSSVLQENVIGVQVIRAFAKEKYEIGRFKDRNRTLFDARILALRQWAKIMPTTQFLVALSTIIVILFGGILVINDQMSVGQVVAFNAYLLMLAGPTQQLAWLVNSAGEAGAGAQRVLEIMELEPEITTPIDAIKLPVLSGKIEFQDVCFQYDPGSVPALEDIHLSIKPNQLIALIGPTGSGKTTLVNLVPRFYDVTTGSVLIDGYDVRSVDLVSLRNQIGIVLQTSLLFSTSIKDNIAFGKPGASLSEIVEAAKMAQAHEFISQLSEGYETIIGERGITLSGGQRQRIAIARALIMDPRILILDDSTSSVDTETEKLIQEALGNLMIGRTTFVIAHRLATVRRADMILVMDQGKIIERGKHADLLSKNGLYKEIYDLQLRDQDKFYEDMQQLNPSVNAVKYQETASGRGIE